MNVIEGTVRNGYVVLDDPKAWAEGTRVLVQAMPPTNAVGKAEEDCPETPEQIAAWLKWYDSLEPLIMTPEEEAAWKAALQERKEFEKANFEKWCQEIEGLFP